MYMYNVMVEKWQQFNLRRPQLSSKHLYIYSSHRLYYTLCFAIIRHPSLWHMTSGYRCIHSRHIHNNCTAIGVMTELIYTHTHTLYTLVPVRHIPPQWMDGWMDDVSNISFFLLVFATSFPAHLETDDARATFINLSTAEYHFRMLPPSR